VGLGAPTLVAAADLAGSGARRLGGGGGGSGGGARALAAAGAVTVPVYMRADAVATALGGGLTGAALAAAADVLLTTTVAPAMTASLAKDTLVAAALGVGFTVKPDASKRTVFVPGTAAAPAPAAPASLAMPLGLGLGIPGGLALLAAAVYFARAVKAADRKPPLTPWEDGKREADAAAARAAEAAARAADPALATGVVMRTAAPFGRGRGRAAPAAFTNNPLRA